MKLPRKTTKITRTINNERANSSFQNVRVFLEFLFVKLVVNFFVYKNHSKTPNNQKMNEKVNQYVM